MQDKFFDANYIPYQSANFSQVEARCSETLEQSSTDIFNHTNVLPDDGLSNLRKLDIPRVYAPDIFGFGAEHLNKHFVLSKHPGATNASLTEPNDDPIVSPDSPTNNNNHHSPNNVEDGARQRVESRDDAGKGDQPRRRRVSKVKSAQKEYSRLSQLLSRLQSENKQLRLKVMLLENALPKADALIEFMHFRNAQNKRAKQVSENGDLTDRNECAVYAALTGGENNPHRMFDGFYLTKHLPPNAPTDRVKILSLSLFTPLPHGWPNYEETKALEELNIHEFCDIYSKLIMESSLALAHEELREKCGYNRGGRKKYGSRSNPGSAGMIDSGSNRPHTSSIHLVPHFSVLLHFVSKVAFLNIDLICKLKNFNVITRTEFSEDDDHWDAVIENVGLTDEQISLAIAASEYSLTKILKDDPQCNEMIKQIRNKLQLIQEMNHFSRASLSDCLPTSSHHQTTSTVGASSTVNPRRNGDGTSRPGESILETYGILDFGLSVGAGGSRDFIGLGPGLSYAPGSGHSVGGPAVHGDASLPFSSGGREMSYHAASSSILPGDQNHWLAASGMMAEASSGGVGRYAQSSGASLHGGTMYAVGVGGGVTSSPASTDTNSTVSKDRGGISNSIKSTYVENSVHHNRHSSYGAGNYNNNSNNNNNNNTANNHNSDMLPGSGMIGFSRGPMQVNDLSVHQTNFASPSFDASGPSLASHAASTSAPAAMMGSLASTLPLHSFRPPHVSSSSVGMLPAHLVPGPVPATAAALGVDLGNMARATAASMSAATAAGSSAGGPSTSAGSSSSSHLDVNPVVVLGEVHELAESVKAKIGRRIHADALTSKFLISNLLTTQQTIRFLVSAYPAIPDFVSTFKAFQRLSRASGGVGGSGGSENSGSGSLGKAGSESVADLTMKNDVDLDFAHAWVNGASF